MSRTSVPRPGALSTSTVPPASTTRPRMDRASPTPSRVVATSKPLPSSRTEQKTAPF